MRFARPAFAALALASLNAWIAWRLFFLEYGDHFNSIEGAFIALGRWMADPSTHWSWWPWWHGGTPFEVVYVPGLHWLTALGVWTSGVSAARSYHFVTAVAYCCGPTALLWMCRRLGSSLTTGFLAGLVWSVFSFATAAMPDMRADMGGFLGSKRLEVLTVYGEGPHVSAISLLPLVMLALQAALERVSVRRIALAALAVSAVMLVNVPGSMAMSVFVFAWLCAQAREQQWRAARIAAVALSLGVAVAMVGVSPPLAATVLANMASMHPGFASSGAVPGTLLAALAAAVWGAGIVLCRWNVPLHARFAWLLLRMLAAMVIPADPRRFELLPQVGRLHLEMDLAFAVASAGLAAATIGRLRWRAVRVVVAVVVLAALGYQTQRCRVRARLDLMPATVTERSEYQSAMWLECHRPGVRVLAPGSESFWLNAFSNVPQLTGCCEQGWDTAGERIRGIAYTVNVAEQREECARVVNWLRIYGVGAVIATGEKSTEVYHDFRKPERFEGLMRKLHEGYGDIIYEVPGAGASLAHVVRPEELVRSAVARDLSISAELRRYLDALADPAREPARMRWTANDAAVIEARMRPGDWLSVQVSFSEGWRARVNGVERRVVADSLGLLAVDAGCEGECSVSLEWHRPWISRLAQAFGAMTAVALLLSMLFREKTRLP